MKFTEEQKEQARKYIKYIPFKPYGGQQCGIPSTIILQCEPVDFSVTIGKYRSQIENKQLALKLFEFYLDNE